MVWGLYPTAVTMKDFAPLAWMEKFPDWSDEIPFRLPGSEMLAPERGVWEVLSWTSPLMSCPNAWLVSQQNNPDSIKAFRFLITLLILVFPAYSCLYRKRLPSMR